MTNDPQTGTGRKAGQQWLSNGMVFGIFAVVILLLVGIGYNMQISGKERDTEIIASLNQLSKNLIVLSNDVGELKSQLDTASTGSQSMSSESVEGRDMTGQAEGADRDSLEPVNRFNGIKQHERA